jgi:hypothetical protein
MSAHDSIHKLKKTTELLTKEKDREPSMREIAEAAGMKLEEVQQLVLASRIVASLDLVLTPTSSKGASSDSATSLVNLIPDARNLISVVETEIDAETARAAIEKYVDPVTREIIYARHSDAAPSWRDLQERFGLPREKMQRMQNEGLRRCSLMLAASSQLRIRGESASPSHQEAQLATSAAGSGLGSNERPAQAVDRQSPWIGLQGRSA